MKNSFARLAVDLQINQDVLVDGVVVVIIMRAILIGPNCFAGFRTARKNRCRPFVVARSPFGVPGSRIRSSVIDEIEFGIVGDPAPYRAAADFPEIFRPCRHAQIFTALRWIKWLESGTDQDFAVGAAGEGLPDDLTGVDVQPAQLAAYAHLAAAVAHEDTILHHQGGHGNGLASIEVGDLRLPNLFPGCRINGDCISIESIKENASV